MYVHILNMILLNKDLNKNMFSVYRTTPDYGRTTLIGIL